jgi:ferredoxin
MPDDVMSANLLDPAVSDEAARRVADDLAESEAADLRPAVLARYNELARLRYDYPLVLNRGGVEGGIIQSLSGIVDGVLQQIAPKGIEGERARKHVLSLEREIRTLTAAGTKGSLSRLWELAQSNLLARTSGSRRTALEESLTRARTVLALDGDVIDCDEGTPLQLLEHVWCVVESDKAQHFRSRIDRIVLGLSDILKVDFMKSDDARMPERLKHSVGTAYENAFDFEKMSQLLGASSRKETLPKKRRQRIEAVLAVLKSQRFFAPTRTGTAKPHNFIFDSCARALAAFEERLPEMVELVKAITIAELELENHYRESAHESFFDGFDESLLRPEDVVLFPSYLVCMRDNRFDAGEQMRVTEALSSGLPIKVLVQSDDILEDLPVGRGKFSFGRRSSQLATTAVGLHDAFVLQASSSHLYSMRTQLVRGLQYDGPALFSVYSGACASMALIPPYLVAAAATESRAFPAFMYDPAAGPDLASRFSIDANSQAGLVWPTYCLDYEDEEHQRSSEDLSFTFADFVACDKRYARHLATLSQDQWHDGVISLGEFLEQRGDANTEKAPYIPMIDSDNALHKLAVDDELIRATRRCAESWRSLQELGGIHSSHAQRLLAKEKELWQQQMEHELAALKARAEPEVKVPNIEQATDAPAETLPAQPETAVEAPADEAYIETPRCTTCDECTQINNRMFAYDDNKQAYIADPDAGTYRELVEAAESCQVAIIHPGKPRNPNEPNLDELIRRAEPFR